MADEAENIIPADGSGESHRRRRRYKYRIKKKKSKKKKWKKYGEYALWFVIIAAFIVSLLLLMREMDLPAKKGNEKRKKSEVEQRHDNLALVCKLQSGYIISHC